jgi:hypothetical protein
MVSSFQILECFETECANLTALDRPIGALRNAERGGELFLRQASGFARAEEPQGSALPRQRDGRG